MQEKIQKNTANSFQNYYNNLKKGEKTRLLNFLNAKYGLSTSTLQGKFKAYEGHEFTPIEIVVIGEVIKNETWKN